jgi:hypothetical protein
MTVTGTDRSAGEILAQIRAQYPDAPFLALGQTVFWDEPVKAVLRRLLDENRLGGQMVIGVHDTDYFAKANLRRTGPSRFVLMPHNDGTTKNLWSAAGEISTLFGSETFPSRHDFIRYGVPFRKLADAHPESRQAFIDAMTEAWGWRGLVYTGSRDLIVNRLSLREVGDGILETLVWGFEHALDQIMPGCCQDEARAVAEKILSWCHTYRVQHPDGHLSDLFQHVLPRLYELLLGDWPANVTVDCTTRLLRFNPATASLPRFRFVDHFLNPATRNIAIDAYNGALAGSEIYTLDRFGAGALPFDCIVPERGRGTLRVTPRVVLIETRQPIPIGLKKPVESVQELAEVLTAKLGPDVTLVGKAVSLVSMLAQEFIFVFNEEGSMYVRRTRHMNDVMRAQGISLDMRPLLRIRYHTWDALSVGRSTLRPTEHLAASFGQPTITTPEFAAAWKPVLAEQRALLDQIAMIRKPTALLRFLRERDPGAPWDEPIQAYEGAHKTLLDLCAQAAELQGRVRERYALLKQLKAQGLALQEMRGAHFRSVSEWTGTEEMRRADFERQLWALEDQKRRLCQEICTLKERRRKLERGPEAIAARAKMAQIDNEAEMARLRLVRNALLTIEGLKHTNHRPSAWWLPMVDPSGEWFRRIVATTEIYTEPLLTV